MRGLRPRGGGRRAARRVHQFRVDLNHSRPGFHLLSKFFVFLSTPENVSRTDRTLPAVTLGGMINALSADNGVDARAAKRLLIVSVRLLIVPTPRFRSPATSLLTEFDSLERPVISASANSAALQFVQRLLQAPRSRWPSISKQWR